MRTGERNQKQNHKPKKQQNKAHQQLRDQIPTQRQKDLAFKIDVIGCLVCPAYTAWGPKTCATRKTCNALKLQLAIEKKVQSTVNGWERTWDGR